MRRAVALAGGGARGCYEFGVWTALRELGVDFDVLTGTSIGAINAALMAQGDYALTRELWETIRVDQVIDGGIDLDLSIEAMFGQLRRLGPFLKKYIGSRGADITPLIRLVKRVIDEEKVRASGVLLGVTAVSFPSLKPLEITLEQMPAGTLHDYLLASAACFPAFPMMKAEGRSYIDGGYYDNLPIDLAVKMGAEEIVAVDLSSKPVHPRYRGMPFVTYIRPSWPLGSFLDFGPEGMRRNQKLGYLDALRAFGRVSGFRYAFDPAGLESAPAERFLRRIMEFEAQAPMDGRLHPGLSADGALSRALREHMEKSAYTCLEALLCGAEICGERFGIDPTEPYTLARFNALLAEHIGPPGDYNYRELFGQTGAPQSIALLRERFWGDRAYLLASAAHWIGTCGDLYGGCKWIASGLPAEFLGALYLDTVVLCGD